MSQKIETNPADIFRRKFEEGRERRQTTGVSIELAGFPCKVKVLPRLFFIQAGLMPEYLTRLLIERNRRNDEAADRLVREQTVEQTIQAETFMREAVCAALIEPKVVPTGDAPEGGYAYAELLENTPAFVQAVYEWIMSDCPVPREEKGEGVLGVEDLDNFPEGGGRRTRAHARGKGKKRRATAPRTDAAD